MQFDAIKVDLVVLTQEPLRLWCAPQLILLGESAIESGSLNLPETTFGAGILDQS